MSIKAEYRNDKTANILHTQLYIVSTQTIVEAVLKSMQLNFNFSNPHFFYYI